MSDSSTADELRQAKQRIAALEKEIQALRASSLTPSHNLHHPQSSTYPSIHPIQVSVPPNPSHIQIPKPQRSIIKPRLVVMTRRASAAAAAAAATSITQSQDKDSKRLDQKDEQVSNLSKHIPFTILPMMSTQSSDLVNQTIIQQSLSSDLSMSKSNDNIPATISTSPIKTIDPKSKDSLSSDPSSNDSNHSISPSSKKTNLTSTNTNGADSSIPRRRPPPLPVVKTSSTKKERHSLVAKCTEPKPGQTRYWTEEEHERFLEAVAEYGEKAYVAISNYVESRTPKQVRTHAQKFQMKMARLARQSIEAGQPVHMPAGMRPVVELPIGTKSTIVSLPSDQVVKTITRTPRGTPVDSAAGKTTTSLNQSKNKPNIKKEDEMQDEKVDELVRVSSTISNESSSVPTDDPYLDYLGASRESEEMKLENTFAVKLTETLQEAASDVDTNDADFIVSEGSSHENGQVENDKLEDIENLEDGDLSLAQFSNSDENWLLSENPAPSSLTV